MERSKIVRPYITKAVYGIREIYELFIMNYLFIINYLFKYSCYQTPIDKMKLVSPGVELFSLRNY